MKRTQIGLALLVFAAAAPASALNVGVYDGQSGSNSTAIVTFLNNNGHTATNFGAPPSAADLTGQDVAILLRANGSADLIDFVSNGGKLITEWTSFDWAANNGLIDATPSGGGFTRSPDQVTFTAAGLAMGLGVGLANPYEDDGRTDYFRNVSAVGAAEVLATRSGGAEAILGQATGAGFTLGVMYDWADWGESPGTLERTQQFLLNAVDIANCFVIDAIDDPFSVINDGATADLSVLANDECSDDTPISVVELPGDLLPDRGGSATTDGAKVRYAPAAGFVGFEEFTYTAQDAGLEGGDDPPAVDQDTAVIVVEVLEDIPPDAVDDTATTLQTQAVIIDVLENDTLGNAPNLVEIETESANGSATVQADDTIRYVPNITSIGEDTFEYRLTDANGDSDVATVTVGVFFVRGQVPIDIMPNSDGNNLNLRAGKGAGIDVAILSVGEYFEAPNLIDPLTLKFGPREGNIWGSPQVRDVDGDGDDDLLVTFLIQQSGIPCGETHAILFGRTFDTQSISGMDAINTFNCPRVRKRH